MPAHMFASLALLIPTILSLSVHEWAHARAARALGDDTAERLGRLTLNPISHFDPIGTGLLPVLQILTTGTVFFAWAKPVPYDPSRFRRDVRMSTGSVLVAIAGPLSNLLLAVGAAVGLGLLARGAVQSEGIWNLLVATATLNVSLAVFNLLPIPPLDGSKVLHGLLPRRGAELYERLFPYAPLVLMGFLVLGGRLIDGPVGLVRDWLGHLAQVIAG